MTRRAARMLAALEDGCETRDEIFAHQGRFSLLNNAAAELRAAGVDVVCELVDGDYRYWLLSEGRRDNGAVRTVPPGITVAPLAEEPDGQLTLVAA